MESQLFSCVIVADPSSAPEVAGIRHMLESDIDVQVETTGFASESLRDDVDLYVPVIGCGNFTHCHAFMNRVLQTDRGARMMPVATDLSQQQLNLMLSSGVADFMTTPLSLSELQVRAYRLLRLRQDERHSLSCDIELMRSRGLIGQSPNFLKQLALLPRIAGSATSVLLLGETGTGKEVFARAVHYLSARAAMPWVAVNCGAIPAELLESELFGHLRGAFTGAHMARGGLVKEAEGGTLFLDEIDSLPYDSQAKLLRFLQDMEYRSVGSDKVCRANVRVIAASNLDLRGAVEQGRFRRDLFYRLNALTVEIPPLRERVEDIYPLAIHFVSRFAMQVRNGVLGLHPQALQRLYEHAWPGNIRELEHVMERAVLLADDAWIGIEHLDLPSSRVEGDDSLRAAKSRLVCSFERAYIERLLRECEGNIGQAARIAKKNRRALFALIRKHGISAESYRSGAVTTGY
ncbi:MAG TPA: sigma-54 dependent transcriptional regulator [Luteibacter sp.]|jgi:two-component system response regulator GlrR|nr:sigma-54 dependent transcriptional regulator [Luteibacter sp.]